MVTQAGGLCYADKNLGTQSITGLGGPIAPDGNGFYRYCGRHNPTAGSKKPFAPRFGFAYRLNDKTVVRGGYGIFFDSAETREIDDSGDIYPFVVRSSPDATVDPTLPKLTDNMFPPVNLHQVSSAIDGSQFFAVIISEFPHNPYVQQWSLSVQRELAKNTTLEVNYVGNKGTHNLNRFNIGQGLPPANPAVCDPDVPGNPPNAATLGDCPAAVRRPFTNITSSLGFLDSQWNGYSNYNAGNVKLERRSSSLALVAVYTWAKSLDDKSAAAGVGGTNAFAGHMDEHNIRLDYGRSSYDVNQRFVTSFVYQLPFGRGKKFGGSMNKAADLAVGGWQVTGITTFQAGFPFDVLADDKLGLLTTFTQRANLVPGCNPGGGNGFHKSITEWFNTSCFTQPLAGQFGNSSRDMIRGPGINNWDMGVGKDFRLAERLSFQFRAEAFNIFNHAQYGVDPLTNTTIGAAVDQNVNDGVFGRVTAARPGRIIQLGGKFIFCWFRVVVLMYACVNYAPAQSAGAIEKYSAEGQQALAQGNYAEAEVAFEKLRELEPGVAEVHANLGAIYFQEGKYQAAVSSLRQALKLKPALPKSSSLLAMSLSELGRYAEALPGLEKGFRQSTDPPLKRMCGLQLLRAYSGLRRGSKAAEVALELNRLYPDDPEVLYHTARIFGSVAFLNMQKLAQVAPASVWRHQAEAEAYESQGSNDAAISEYRQVLSADPRRPGIHYRIGRTLLARSRQSNTPDDTAAAAKEFEQELLLDHANANAAYELGELHRDAGEFNEAQKFFEQALQAYPDFEEAQLGLAAALTSLQKPDLALPHLQKAVTLNPGNEVAWYRLSQVQGMLGHEAEQKKAFAEFQRLRNQKSSQQEAGKQIFSPDEVTRQQLDQSAPK